MPIFSGEILCTHTQHDRDLPVLSAQHFDSRTTLRGYRLTTTATSPVSCSRVTFLTNVSSTFVIGRAAKEDLPPFLLRELCVVLIG
jgi:hypothetical protein